jgi:branched-subunit amino acid transport protein AzlD
MNYKKLYNDIIDFLARVIAFALLVVLIHYATDGFQWRAASTYIQLFIMWIVMAAGGRIVDIHKRLMEEGGEE